MDSDRFTNILMVTIIIIWFCWLLAKACGCVDYSTSNIRYKYKIERTYNKKKNSNSYKSSKSSRKYNKSNKSNTSYDYKDYEEFYDDNEEDFDSIDDAEDYYDEHYEDF